jgi:hypothetical protein
MNAVIIETIVSVLANLAVTLIGVAGAWLVTQIGKKQQLHTINAADKVMCCGARSGLLLVTASLPVALLRMISTLQMSRIRERSRPMWWTLSPAKRSGCKGKKSIA